MVNNKVINMKKQSWRIFKRNGLVLNACAALIVTFAASASFADNVLPTGGAYTSGTGTIGTVGNVMNIDQNAGTTYGITTWNSFSVGSENTVNINNGSNYTMARVTGNTASMINGNLNATGTAYLINQNGVVVGNSGVVTTGGAFVASTRDISDADFLNGGQNTFEGASAGDVINNGVINSNGNTILVGRVIENTGNINANGDALLGAGNKVILTETNSAGQRMSVEVAGGSINNNGTIEGINAELKANGGNIYALAINNSGTVRARGVTNSGGRVVLSADNDVTHSGDLLASNTGSNGAVTITGKNINLNSRATVNTGVNGTFSAYAANSSPASQNWRNGTGTININGSVNIESDGINLNSGKREDGTRADLSTNANLLSSDGQFGTVIINGFNDVNLNADNNSTLNTSGSVIINAKNITVDENFQVSGDLVLNAAAFNDTTNNFVQEAGTNTNALFSDGWKTNSGIINFAGDGAINFNICCGVTLTSGLDTEGNRVDLTDSQATFSYNNESGMYKWYEAKGFDLFHTTFEDDALRTANEFNLSDKGFVKLINNTNVIDFDVLARHDILIVSNQDTLIDNVTIQAGWMETEADETLDELVIAVDEANPFSAGAGKLTVSQGAELIGEEISLYTSQQANNEINGTLNGQTFVEGTEFVNSNQEEWAVFYQNADRTGKDPFMVYYKNNGTPFRGRSDCASNPGQAGCEDNADYAEQGREYRVALSEDNTNPEEGSLAWGNSSQVRNNEFFTIKSRDYLDSNLSTNEKLTTFFTAIPLELVNIPLSGLALVPGIQGIAEGIRDAAGINPVVR